MTVQGDLPVDVTSYVGRTGETAEAQRLLSSVSVVTLTGPGGVGKTRLAARVAELERTNFADGVVFASLAELQDPALLVNLVEDLLGLEDRSPRPGLEVLTEQLADRELLLVLDNCEHMVEACADLVDSLVAACPKLAVLATSRQTLGVAGEHVLPIQPLSIPEPDESSAGMLGYDAVKLLIDRATAVVPSFQVNDDNAADVADLCRRLDGLPLAIELAAVRLRALSVRQLLERLDRQFDLLAASGRRGRTSRHETLYALIDWSYELCSAQERLLWARLSVFAGSIVLDAAEAVCGGDGIEQGEVVDLIDSLIDKSILLRVEQRHTVRYRLLESVRQYGADQLQASDELTHWQRRHRDYYLRLADEFAANWLGPSQAEWVARVRGEHANVRRAISFCASDPREARLGLHVVYSLKEYWLWRGLLTEARVFLGKLQEVAAEESVELALATAQHAFFSLVQGDTPTANRALLRAGELVERVDSPLAKALITHVRGYQALIGNDMPKAAKHFGQAADAMHRVPDTAGELWSRYNYGLATALSGELDQGRDVLRQCIQSYTDWGERFWRCWAVWSLSAAEYLAGDTEAARAALAEVLREQQELGDRATIAFALTVAAGVATHTGEDRRAARLLGAAMAVWRMIGASPNNYGAFTDSLQEDTAAVTGRLGAEDAASEFAEGYAMTPDQAVEYALAEASRTIEEPATPLTSRETEIADLVAKGLTNREIAAELHIAPRTAESHVQHILTKLGLHNRAQIAVWVTDLGRR